MDTSNSPNGRPTTNDSTSSAAINTASLKDDGEQLKHKAASTLGDEASARKGQVADSIKQVSSALDAARSDLDDNNAPDWIKSGLRSIATRVGSLADELENKDVSELASGVRSFATQHPSTFLGACAAAGFAAARIFSAGASGSSRQTSSTSTSRSGAGEVHRREDMMSSGTTVPYSAESAAPGSGTLS